MLLRGVFFMKLIADTHCHTISSGHAFSSILENIHVAKEAGLMAVAVPDHSPSTPGGPHVWYFNNLKVIPRQVDGIYVLRGIEANVKNPNADLDIPSDIKATFDWVVASIHDVSFDGPHDIDACTQTWLNICKNPIVNVIGHSGLENYKYDYDKVIPEFGKKGKLVEINNASFICRKGNISNCVEIAKTCKKHGVSVIVNSDAHFCKQVGHCDLALQLLKEIDFPEELIINADADRFKTYLQKYTPFFNIN